MPRSARIVIPGCPHHVTQRGNNRQDVFFVDDDRRVYLRLLAMQTRKFGLKIEGYCLMANHVHLIATPAGEDSLALAVGRTNLLYAQYVNRLHGRSGHLWQNRFYSCAMDEEHFWSALCYIERNPVRAGMVVAAWDYPWSSAATHCGILFRGRPGAAEAMPLLDLADWRRRLAVDWKEALNAGQSDELLVRLRRYTSTGRPLAADSFLGKLEVALGRRLRPLPRGRPKSEKTKSSQNW